MASTTRNRTPRLAVLGSSARRPASSFASRSGSALRRRIVVACLVVASLGLITASFRESSGGPLHGVQNAGATALRPFEVAAERIARPFRDAYGWFHGLVTAQSENDRLKHENQELRQRYVAARSALNENVELSRMLAYERGADFPAGFRAVNARVIGWSPTQFQHEITISAGTSQGIHEDDPVVTADGLVGRVSRVAATLSRVTLLIDPTSSVAATDLTSKARGIVERGAGTGTTLVFNRVPKEQIVQKDDIVITAGTQLGALPDIYPKGIQIGYVTSVDQRDVDIFKRIQVQPFADFSGLDAVAVLVPRKGR